MPMQRRRRIVRTVLWTCAALVLLPVWYIVTWLTVSRAEHEGHVGLGTAHKLRPAFVPLLHYSDSELPGSELLRRTWWFVNPPVIVKGRTTSSGEVFAGTIWIGSPLQPPPPPEVVATINLKMNGYATPQLSIRGEP